MSPLRLCAAPLAPFPPKLPRTAALLDGPPGFDRKVPPEADRKIVDFSNRRL